MKPSDKSPVSSNIKSIQIPPQRRRKIEESNTQSDIEIMLIALINQFSSIVIGKSQKQTIRVHQFFKIKRILFTTNVSASSEFDCIDVQKYVKERRMLFLVNNINDINDARKARRTAQLKKKYDVIHLLEDILLSYGYIVEIECEKSEGVEGKIRIFKDGKLIENELSIKRKASSIHDMISSKLGTNSEVLINTAELNHLL